MTCSHCVGSVQAAIAGVPGVTAVSVSLDDAIAEVEGAGYDRDALVKAIEDAGFGVRIRE
jgi:copper chaperone CopZ